MPRPSTCFEFTEVAEQGAVTATDIQHAASRRNQIGDEQKVDAQGGVGIDHGARSGPIFARGHGDRRNCR